MAVTQVLYKFVAEELDQPSPMAKVKGPNVPISDVTTATEDDLKLLLKTCSAFRTPSAPRDAAIVSVLGATGLRRAELAALRLDDLDFDTMTAVVRRSKNGMARRVPFDSAAPHVLRWMTKRASYPQQHETALWLGKEGPLTGDGIRHMPERRGSKANVKVSSHSFRRGRVASFMTAGITTAPTMQLMGWKTDMSAR